MLRCSRPTCAHHHQQAARQPFPYHTIPGLSQVDSSHCPPSGLSSSQHIRLFGYPVSCAAMPWPPCHGGCLAGHLSWPMNTVGSIFALTGLPSPILSGSPVSDHPDRSDWNSHSVSETLQGPDRKGCPVMTGHCLDQCHMFIVDWTLDRKMCED